MYLRNYTKFSRTLCYSYLILYIITGVLSTVRSNNIGMADTNSGREKFEPLSESLVFGKAANARLD